ncbi:MAG: catalase family peroxidase [Actinomycetes bacterium]
MDAPADLSEQLVDALNAVSGSHPGFRAAHARGVLATGTFRAGPAAPRFSSAAHLQGAEIPVVGRFSNGSGDPGAPDHARDGRGMALKLGLPDGTSTDLVGLTMPMFFVRTPTDFLGFLAARRPDPSTGGPDMAAIGAWLEAHPETLPAVQFALSAELPASYATCTYYGVHTFVAVDADGNRRPFRYHWSPDAGVETISDADAVARGDRYLADELARRLADGSFSFGLRWTFPDDGDPLDDPTQVWPDGREQVDIGRLDITGLADDPGLDRMIWDPNRVIDGIECSADPILAARGGAYGVSYRRRTTA